MKPLLRACLGGIALVAAAVSALPVAAVELKIGFVNAARVLKSAPQAEAALNRLEKEFSPRDKALVEAQKALRKLEDRLSKDGATLSDAERRDLERDIISQRRDVKRAQDEFREDFNIRRNEEMSKLQKLIQDAITALAQEERYDLVLNDGAVIYASEAVDITDKVLKRLSVVHGN